MSKEVGVTGIQLTATTPELIEISFGKEDSAISGSLAVPGNNAGDTEWVHSAATGSVYSSFGKIKPASSTDGNKLYYTDNATEFGKNVAADAKFEEATATVKKTVKTVGKTEQTGDDLTAETDTNKEGYFVDIPVWFRTTKDTDINLGVSATFDNVPDHVDYSLYKAARVAILDPLKIYDASDDVAVSPNSKGVILNTATGKEGTYYNNTRTEGNTQDYAVSGARTDTAAATLASVYGVVTKVEQTTETGGNVTAGTAVAVVQGRTSSNSTDAYSGMTKKIIRVWLEGEDQACWNENASQNFVISLKFYDIGTPSDG